MHARGAADMIAEMDGDDYDLAIINQPSYLGGPFVSAKLFHMTRRSIPGNEEPTKE
jgi:hypothetical protein